MFARRALTRKAHVVSHRRAGSFRRFRPSGFVFLLITILTLLAAWNTGANLLYLVVGGLASFLAISLVSVGWMVRGLRVNREVPEAVHRGEPLGVTLRIENPARLMPALMLRIESVAHPGRSAGFVTSIPPGRVVVLRMSEVFDRRGLYPLPAVSIGSLFPFGLVEKRRLFPDAAEVVVYPRVNAVRASAIEQLPGARLAPRRPTGDGTEFFSLREYVRGDDLRRIAWRASARLGTLVVREVTQEASRFVVFVLDAYRREGVADFDERFEEAVELVASLAVTLLNQQFSVALATPAACLPEGMGNSQVLKVLDLLARVQPTGVAECPAVEAFVAARASEARVAVVSPDPARWGAAGPTPGSRVLDPREVTHA